MVQNATEINLEIGVREWFMWIGDFLSKGPVWVSLQKGLGSCSVYIWALPCMEVTYSGYHKT